MRIYSDLETATNRFRSLARLSENRDSCTFYARLWTSKHGARCCRRKCQICESKKINLKLKLSPLVEEKTVGRSAAIRIERAHHRNWKIALDIFIVQNDKWSAIVRWASGHVGPVNLVCVCVSRTCAVFHLDFCLRNGVRALYLLKLITCHSVTRVRFDFPKRNAFVSAHVQIDFNVFPLLLSFTFLFWSFDWPLTPAMKTQS